jgi:hypothetical protein
VVLVAGEVGAFFENDELARLSTDITSRPLATAPIGETAPSGKTAATNREVAPFRVEEHVGRIGC